MKIIFAGTPEFASVALKKLLTTSHTVLAVFTQPDRPAGRGRKLTPSPVKELALAHNIPVYQPESLKGKVEQQELAALNADIMIVAAYGLLLPPDVLKTPRLGCVNIHASLLPRWRGAAPIHRAIEAGDKETGITIMQMDAGLDTGDMLLKMSCPILDTDTTATLHDKLADIGGNAIITALIALERGELNPEKQNDADAVYAHKLRKTEAIIDWNLPAEHIERKIRAFNPWPVAQTEFNKNVLRIWAAEVKHETSSAAPGKVLSADKSGIDVATGEGILRLTRLQLPGGKPQEAHQFLNSNDIAGYLFH